MGDFGTQARVIDRAKRPPCAFRDAAQGNDLRRHFNRLDRRATKAAARLRRLAAPSDRPVRFSMPLRGNDLRRRSNRLDRRATNTGDAIAAFGRDERPPCAFLDAAQGKACAGASTGLTGAQRIRATRLRHLAATSDRPCAFRDAAQGNDLRRRSNRLDRRATKAERDCGACPSQTTALSVPRCGAEK